MNRGIHTNKAPEPIGPYSQAIEVPPGKKLIFCAGQVALKPGDDKLVGEGIIKYQTQLALENLRSVLKAAGATFRDVVKTTVFMINLRDFPEMNAIYGLYFTEKPYPARSTVEVSGLPKGAMVEIEAVAAVDA